MEIIKPAMAGTMESSDCQITVRPANSIEIELESNVKVMFGKSILATTHTVLDEMGVTGAAVEIRDKGALDCVLRARLQCAICRAAETGFDWKKEAVSND